MFTAEATTVWLFGGESNVVVSELHPAAYVYKQHILTVHEI